VRILDADDLQAALNASGYRGEVSTDALETSAEAIDAVAQFVLTAQELPGIGALRATQAALQDVEDRCGGILGLIQPLVEHSATEQVTADSVARALAVSRDPLAVALLDAAQSLGGGEQGEKCLSKVLLAVNELMVWAQAAGAQFEAGIRREKVSRTGTVERSPARAAGMEVIRVYRLLTGQPIRFSRGAAGSARAGEPGGPLIRFLTETFAALRRRVAATPEYTAHIRDRSWSPDRETLASWIRQARKVEKTAGC